MIYYIFKTQIFTIFLSLQHLTAITFPDKITDYVGGQKEDFKIYEVNKGRSLVFSPKRRGIDRNFIVFSRAGKFHYNVRYSDEFANKDIEIREAKKCNLHELVKDTKQYQLFECPKSLLFVNKMKEKVQVNDQFIRDKAFLSKGPPIYLNGKMIYYKRMGI